MILLIRIVNLVIGWQLTAKGDFLRFESLTTEWDDILLSFYFVNENQITSPSNLHFEKNSFIICKTKWQPDVQEEDMGLEKEFVRILSLT